MKLSVKIWKEDGWYVARVPELGVTTQGRTRNSAKKNLKEATKLHLNSMVDYMIQHDRVKIERGHLIKA